MGKEWRKLGIVKTGAHNGGRRMETDKVLGGTHDW